MKRTVPFFLALAVYLCASLSARAATVTININNFAFSPPSQPIQVGDTVTWVNMDLTTHTSTSGTPPVADGNWASGFLSQNQSFSHTFTAAGTFSYFCSIHTFM